MAIDRERFEELCASYVVGALDGDDLGFFHRTISERDPEALSIYFEMRKVSLLLPLSVEMTDPPSGLRASIMSRIAPSGSALQSSLISRLARSLGFSRPQVALSFSMILVLIVAGLSWYSLFLGEKLRQRDAETTQLNEELSRQNQQFTAVREELHQKNELLKILQAPRIDLVIMSGQEVNPAGYGKIIWDPEKKTAILQISNLPAVPRGKDYQLWVIKNKKPMSAGVFTVNDPVTETMFKIDQLVETDKKVINAFAITLEPKGGVPQPTGKMYLLGTPGG